MRYLNFLAILIVLSACGGNSEPSVNLEETATPYSEHEEGLLGIANRFFSPLPEVATSKNNVLSAEKILLGETLYMDTRLSKDGNISCNSCHAISGFGVDNLATSPGDEGMNGDRNSPTVFNAALHTSQFWDGRAEDVEEQAGMPILNPVEMNIPNEAFLVERLKGIDEYLEMFTNAFPDATDPLTYDNLKLAIAAFERTLLTPSPFDAYLAGNEDAMSNEAKEGLYQFIKLGCTTCHSGVVLGGNMFQKFGLYGDYWELTGSDPIDEGRFKVSGNEAEKYMFKVPSLRNIAKTGPYLHDGSMDDLNEVIRIMGKLQLNKTLDENQVNNIRSFLESLTGELPTKVAL